MVQLNTSYDKTLKQRIFILKGEEGYARTTDTVADVISDFDDCNTHISYARIGLQIEVYRAIGDSFVNIYNNEELLYSIPWKEGRMDSTIDESWNSQGIYWIDDKLFVGISDDYKSGLKLGYDMEHNLQVRYTGNKQCLASKSEVLQVYEEEPDSYSSKLTVSSKSNFDTGETASFTINLAIEQSDYPKHIKVYEGTTLIDEFDMSANTPYTYNLANLNDGLHNLKFVFAGDDEATYSEALTDISVGYIVTVTDKPSYTIKGDYSTVSVNVKDYFNEPVPYARVTAIEYIDGGKTPISPEFTTDADGNSIIAPVYISSNPWSVYYDGEADYYSSRESTIAYDNVTLVFDAKEGYVAKGYSNTISGVLYGNLNGATTELPNESISVSIAPYMSVGGLPPQELPPDSAYSKLADVITDEDGRFSYTYTGTGRGESWIKCYKEHMTNEGEDALIKMTDIYQKWSSKGSINENRGGKAVKVSNGYRLALSSSDGNTIGAYAIQPEMTQSQNNWQTKFIVRSKTNTARLDVWFRRAGGFVGGVVSTSMNLSNATVIVTYINKIMTMYVNGNVVSRLDASKYDTPYGSPQISIVGSTNQSIIFDDVEIMNYSVY